jgi:hypothetical protein
MQQHQGGATVFFGTDLTDPETLWVNVANIVLGLTTILCIGAVAWGVASELLARARRSWRLASDDHAYSVPQLGLTMADGGEKLVEKETEDD